MELTTKVNQNSVFKAKVLLVVSYAVLSACTTLNSSSREIDKQNEILDHQIGIIINHLNVGEPEKAHFETRPLLRQYPERAELHNLMGLSYMGLKRPKLAEGYFRKAFNLQPDPSFGLNITSSLIEQKQFKEALKLLRGFKKDGLGDYKYPERYDHNIALVFERMNKNRLAIKHYRAALAVNPSNFQTLMQLGRLYERMKMAQQAEPVFKKAADVCLRCYEPVKRRSDALVSLGRKNEAIRSLLDYLETQDLRPEDLTHARRYVSRLDPSFLQPRKKNN